MLMLKTTPVLRSNWVLTSDKMTLFEIEIVHSLTLILQKIQTFDPVIAQFKKLYNAGCGDLHMTQHKTIAPAFASLPTNSL